MFTKKRCFKSYPKKSSPQGVLTDPCFQPHPLNNEAARPVDPAAGPCAETAHGRRPEPVWVQKFPLLISYYETKWNMLFQSISWDFIWIHRAPHSIRHHHYHYQAHPRCPRLWSWCWAMLQHPPDIFLSSLPCEIPRSQGLVAQEWAWIPHRSMKH